MLRSGLLLATFALVAVPTRAADDTQAVGDLRALADEAKTAFAPLGEEDLAAARAELATRVLDAERLLRPTTPGGAAWLDYLKWEGVQKQLAPDAAPDVAAARATLQQLASGADGLERHALRRVAESLERYVGVAQFAPADADRQRKSYEFAVDGLADLLADTGRLATARGSYEAERRLGLLAGLEPTGRGAEFVRRVRDDYGHANLYFEVDAATLNRVIARPVNECSGVNDCILGTRVTGTGATDATLTVTPLAAAGHARLAFHLSGTVRSRTTGINGPAQIRSLGNTAFGATAIVELSDQTFRALPADASASTRTRTLGVSKVGGGIGSRLVAKIGSQRVAEKRPQADAIASRRAETKIEQRLDAQLAEQIAEARARYEDRLQKPLRRRGATPRRITQQTTSDALRVEAVQAGPGQLAAWGEPPAAVAAPIAGRLHQTAVSNLLDAYLGGATLRRDSVDEPTKIDIVAPPWLKLKADQPAPGEVFQAWSVRLRSQRPVSVEFAEGRVKAIIHTARIQVEDKQYDGWDLIAVYEPQRIDGAWRLVRQGDVEVLPTRFDPASGERLGSSDVGLRNNLAKALNDRPDRVPQVVKIDPIDLTDREGPIDFLSLTDIAFTDGWMSAGWRPQ